MDRSPLSHCSPANLWVGLGCRRGTQVGVFRQGLQQICQDYQIDWCAIAGIATLDLKQTESGLLEFSLAQNWSLIYFSQTELENNAVPNPSSVVNAAVGVSSVCEAAALRAASQSGTWAPRLLVPKQIFRGSSGLGTVTIAIAQACRPSSNILIPTPITNH